MMPNFSFTIWKYIAEALTKLGSGQALRSWEIQDDVVAFDVDRAF